MGINDQNGVARCFSGDVCNNADQETVGEQKGRILQS